MGHSRSKSVVYILSNSAVYRTVPSMSQMNGVMQDILHLYEQGKTIPDIQKALDIIGLNYTCNELSFIIQAQMEGLHLRNNSNNKAI